MYKILFRIFSTLMIITTIGLLHSCRTGDDYGSGSTEIEIGEKEKGEVKGFFLLNEGNMGSNKATLDYYNYETATYHKNIFSKINPEIAHELGDVGNDIKIYGDKLYVILNTSHMVEVMDAQTAKHIGTITIPNCRYITFHKGYAYVSSYAGPVEIDPNARLGYVAKIDTTTLTVLGECVVGYQPEEMVIRDNKLYVANSGGYRVPEYDNRVSVIDLNSFTEIKKIEVGINLHRMKLDSDNNIYTSSRGDYHKISSKTYVIGRDDRIIKTYDLPASNMTVNGDSIYIYSNEWSALTEKNVITYAIINTKMQSVVSRGFLKDGSEQAIKTPYGIAVNPSNRTVFITDAKNHLTPGTLHCYSEYGQKLWSVTTGDVPAHFVFTRRALKGLTQLQENR